MSEPSRPEGRPLFRDIVRRVFVRDELSVRDEDAFKSKVVVFFSMFLAIWAPIYSPVMWWMTGSIVPFASTMFCGVCVMCTLLMFKRGWSYKVMGNWLAFNLFWIEFFLPFFGGINESPLLWMAVVPIMAAILAGTYSGIFWLFMSSGAVLLYHGLLYQGHEFTILMSPENRLIFHSIVNAGLCVIVVAFVIAFNTTMRDRLKFIRRAEQQNNMVLQTVAEAIFLVDDHGRIEVANQAAIELFNMGAEMDGLPIVHLIGERTGDQAARTASEEMKAWAEERKEVWGRRSDGSRIALEVAAARAEDEDGVVRFVITAQDITERKRAELAIHEARDEALRASEAKSVFLANMSHELRTPLNAILGYSELVREDLEEEGGVAGPQIMQDLLSIQAAGNHLLSLINDVLDLSKIESGRMDVYLESVQLPQLLRDIVATVDAQVRANQNRFKPDIEEAPEVMVADHTKLKQILLNLLSNAAKFTKKGLVRLNVNVLENPEGDQHVIFEVIDTGKGIAPEKLESLFDAFVQEDSSTQRQFGGTGLGLTLSRQFAEMMDGTLTVMSQPGQGSTFRLSLPFRVEERPGPGLEHISTPLEDFDDHPEAVLVIDDDPEIHALYKRFLQQEGNRTLLSALSGEHGIELARSQRPGVIALDVLMPDMDGWSVLELLKNDPVTSDIPVVMSTIVDDFGRSRELGADDHMVKPIKRDHLRQVLERFVPQRTRILVVEDDDSTRDLLERMLAGQGFEVALACDGLEALQQLHELSPDVVLLDLMMPKLDGFGVLDRMREENLARIPVVIHTAMDLDHPDVRDLHLEVISKASGQDHLLKGLSRAIDASQTPTSHLISN